MTKKMKIFNMQTQKQENSKFLIIKIKIKIIKPKAFIDFKIMPKEII